MTTKFRLSIILIKHECNAFVLFPVEFLLDSASSYAPTDTVSLENAMFLFQVAPGTEGIVAHGFNRIGKALFAVYARLEEGDQVIVEGTSGQTVSSGTVLIIHPWLTSRELPREGTPPGMRLLWSHFEQ